MAFPPIATQPIPPIPPGEVEFLRNENSWLVSTMLLVANILGMTEGTLKDLPAHASKIMQTR